jgi:tetratricopeptide (TPR) repeat protein
MGNYLDEGLAFKADQQELEKRNMLADRQKQQYNALQQIDPNNPDPNLLWQAGRYQDALDIVQRKINESTDMLAKAADVFRDHVMPYADDPAKAQSAYQSAIASLGKLYPQAGKALAAAPKDFNKDELGMFIAYASKAVKEKPEFILHNDGVNVTAYNIRRLTHGQPLGAAAPKGGDTKLTVTHDALGRPVPVTMDANGQITSHSPIGPGKPQTKGAGDSGVDRRAERSRADKFNKENAEIRAARTAIIQLEKNRSFNPRINAEHAKLQAKASTHYVGGVSDPDFDEYIRQRDGKPASAAQAKATPQAKPSGMQWEFRPGVSSQDKKELQDAVQRAVKEGRKERVAKILEIARKDGIVK